MHFQNKQSIKGMFLDGGLQTELSKSIAKIKEVFFQQNLGHGVKGLISPKLH